MIAAAFAGDALKDYPNVDGVAAFVHGTGCGMATKGDGFDILQRTLCGYLKHPNFAGVLLIGLGCEAAQIRFLIDIYGDRSEEHTSALQSLMRISYADFCLKTNNNHT